MSTVYDVNAVDIKGKTIADFEARDFLRMNISDDEITVDLIDNLIQDHKKNVVPRYMLLNDYYRTKNRAIMDKPQKGTNPNEKVASSFAFYMVTVAQGYFTGNAPNYDTPEDNKQMREDLTNIIKDNDDGELTAALDKESNIKGLAYKLIYIEWDDLLEKSRIRIAALKPENVIMVMDNTPKPTPLFAVVLSYEVDPENISNRIEKVTLYTRNVIRYYIRKDGKLKEDKAPSNIVDENGNLSKEEVFEEHHYLGEVPVIPFQNNSEMMGVFERQVTEIDARDKALSNILNDLEYDVDAFLALSGMQGSDNDDIDKMRTRRVILEGEGQGSRFVEKNPSNEKASFAIEELGNAILDKSGIPLLNDKNFGGNQSGVAIRQKLFPLETLVSEKEKKFIKGKKTANRIIIEAHNRLFNTDYDPEDIEVSFTRNMPVNTVEEVKMFIDLAGHLSLSTRLSLLSFIDNLDAEKAKLDEEKEEGIELSEFDDLTDVQSILDFIYRANDDDLAMIRAALSKNIDSSEVDINEE